MAFLMASAIGVLTAAGVFLLLRARSYPVILGLTLLSYAVNLFLVAMGHLGGTAAPILRDDTVDYVDPLPQALVLTAIVIGFGMTAFVVALALRARLLLQTDHVDGAEPPARGLPAAPGAEPTTAPTVPDSPHAVTGAAGDLPPEAAR